MFARRCSPFMFRNHLPMPTLISQRIASPLGALYVCASARGVCLLEFAGTQRIARESRALERRFGCTITLGENEHTRQTAAELGEYFAGTRRDFGVALHPVGSDFQRRVWAALCAIPYGTTTHYQALAASIGHPAAVRAVAAANGANAIAILIPCHRVIGKNGTLTGYGGGLQRKARLLAHEHGGDACPTLPLFP